MINRELAPLPSSIPMTTESEPERGIEDALRELISAARAGCSPDCQDWRFRPAWRQRLFEAVQRYDALLGIVPIGKPRNKEQIVCYIAPKAQPVVIPGDITADFARFWSHYPRKAEGGRFAAEAAYRKARRRAGADEILAGLLAYPFRSDPAYQPQAAGWLDRGCWLAEQDTAPPTVIRERSGRRHEAAELAEEIGLDLMTPIDQQYPKEQEDGQLIPKPGTNYAVAD